MIDLKTLTPEELEALRFAVLDEQERRDRLARTAAIVTDLAAQFVADGGDIAALSDALATATAEPEPLPQPDPSV